MPEIDQQFRKEIKIGNLLRIFLDDKGQLTTQQRLNITYDLHNIDSTILSNENQIEAYHIVFGNIGLNTLHNNSLPLKLKKCFNAPDMLSKIYSLFYLPEIIESVFDDGTMLNMVSQLQSKILTIKEKNLILKVLQRLVCRFNDRADTKSQLG